jgi:hypothetical protein
MVASIPQISSALNFFVNTLLFMTVTTKYLNSTSVSSTQKKQKFKFCYICKHKILVHINVLTEKTTGNFRVHGNLTNCSKDRTVF